MTANLPYKDRVDLIPTYECSIAPKGEVRSNKVGRLVMGTNLVGVLVMG